MDKKSLSRSALPDTHLLVFWGWSAATKSNKNNKAAGIREPLKGQRLFPSSAGSMCFTSSLTTYTQRTGRCVPLALPYGEYPGEPS